MSPVRGGGTISVSAVLHAKKQDILPLCCGICTPFCKKDFIRARNLEGKLRKI